MDSETITISRSIPSTSKRLSRTSIQPHYHHGLISTFSNMRDPSIANGRRSPNETIAVIIDRLMGDQWLYLDPDVQDMIWFELKTQNPPISRELVFDHVKEKVDPKYRIELSRDDLDLDRIVHFIGYLRGYWENPYIRPAEGPRVEIFRSSSYYGIQVIVHQNSDGRAGPDGAACFNPNEQRFAYDMWRNGSTDLQISRRLLALNRSARQFTDRIMTKSVRLLLEFIHVQVQNPPPDQIDHWRRVSSLYDIERGDMPTVLHQQYNLPRPQPAPAPAPALASEPARPPVPLWNRSPPQPYLERDPNSPTNDWLHFGGSSSQGGGQGS